MEATGVAVKWEERLAGKLAVEKFGDAVHGTAPGRAGKGIANPISMILSAAMMLVHLGEKGAAQSVEKAVETVLREGKVLTSDLGGRATTKEITDAIIAKL